MCKLRAASSAAPQSFRYSAQWPRLWLHCTSKYLHGHIGQLQACETKVAASYEITVAHQILKLGILERNGCLFSAVTKPEVNLRTLRGYQELLGLSSKTSSAMIKPVLVRHLFLIEGCEAVSPSNSKMAIVCSEYICSKV